MDDELKEKLLPAILAFNIAVVGFLALRGFKITLPTVMLGVLIGGVIAGATFGIMHYLQNR